MKRFLSEMLCKYANLSFCIFMCTAVRIDHMTYDGDSCYETCVYDNVHLDVNLYIHMHAYIHK